MDCNPTPNRVILHVDMDAFYASVEQRENPALRGKPVVVGADPRGGRGRGVVAACSYEARKFGIHSAMPISQAYRLCPGAVYLQPRHSFYAQVSRRVMEILHSFTPLVEPLSIDEAFLDGTSAVPLYGTSRRLAEAIKEKIRAQEELTCSIGIAPNKFVAKIASDLCKPDGILEVPAKQLRSFLDPLPVRRIWGVGPKTEEKLRRLGILTIGQAARYDSPFWREHFGKRGEEFRLLAAGIDERPVRMAQEIKSISHEHTFDRDSRDWQQLERTLLRLSQGVAERLKGHNFQGGTVVLKIRFSNFATHTRQRRLGEPTSHYRPIFQTARELLHLFHPLPRPVRLLGVGITHLQPLQARQLKLFGPGHREERLRRGLEAILQKYGRGSLLPASLLRKKEGQS